MRRVVFKELLKKKVNKDVYSKVYDKNKLIFIHTPKTAGTSISLALYGEDPWHFSLKELKLICNAKFNEYFKFSFVRNPWSRMFSTYNYAHKWIQKHPESSIKFVTEFKSFEDFIINGLSEKTIENHYFFWTYYRYLNYKGLCPDFVGKFENLEEDLNRLENIINQKVSIQKHNVGINLDYRDAYTDEMKEKVGMLYREDVVEYNYKFDI